MLGDVIWGLFYIGFNFFFWKEISKIKGGVIALVDKSFLDIKGPVVGWWDGFVRCHVCYGDDIYIYFFGLTACLELFFLTCLRDRRWQ
jgi:hypothetical protein